MAKVSRNNRQWADFWIRLERIKPQLQKMIKEHLESESPLYTALRRKAE